MISSNIAPTDWELKVNIYEFDIIEHSMRVKGEMHIGGVIFQLVDQLNHIRNDWSDFALWWPDKNQWLNKTKMTLDQYGVQADALLHFTRLHKNIRVKLPDQQIVSVKIDASLNLFNGIKQICKELSIRHPEEVSLLRFNTHINTDKKVNHIKSNDSNKIQMSQSLTINSRKTSNLNNHDEIQSNKDNSSLTPNSTLNNQLHDDPSVNGAFKFVHDRSQSVSLEKGVNSESQTLALSPILPTQDYLFKNEMKYRNLFDKTKINSRWIDSSKSLMEHNIRDNDLIQLKFKYYAFMDLNLKDDLIRINQIYEQAKWSILSEEVDCTETELIKFAALQLQIQLLTKSLFLNSNNIFELNSSLNSNNKNIKTENVNNESNRNSNRTNSILDQNIKLMNRQLSSKNSIEDEDDVDTALSKLEKSLDIAETSTYENRNGINIKSISQSNIERHLTENKTDVKDNLNELCEELYVIKQQKYTFKKLKLYYFILNDTHYLSYYKNKDESNGKPIDKINLRGCELVPDVNISARKFGINLQIPSTEGINEVSLRCLNEESYARWMSACKLASKNKSLSDPSFFIESRSILNLLHMQQQKHQTNSSNTSLADRQNGNSNKSMTYSSSMVNFSSSDNADVQATNLLPTRILKKHKLKQLNDKILEAYSTISDLDLFESKWRYIKAWQALPNYGVSYFVVKIKGSRLKEEILGVASNRLLRINPDGEIVKTWRFNTMKSWNVNWDIKQFEIKFDEEDLTFLCINFDAKILHEFIGGYIFLSLRMKEKPETFDEEMFFKLTEKK